MIPEKLKPGDEIRVIAPSRSMGLISESVKDIAKKRLENLGLKVTFGEHIDEEDEFTSSSIQSRLEDLHSAFRDKNVKAIISVIGGHNTHQILDDLDFNLIKENPKILCGYSDITALQNAIYKKTGLVTYSGPHFSTFGMLKGFDYIEEYFKKCLMENSEYEVIPSEKWSSDEWYIDQEKRNFLQNDGFFVINEGSTRGTIVGGNMGTFNLLHGTEYMPIFDNTILFLENDVESENEFVVNFDRFIQSNIHQPNFEQVKGIVIGRFQSSSGMTKEKLVKIIKNKEKLRNIPIIGYVDFGHTDPMITFPIGGTCEINISKKNSSVKIINH